MREINYTERGVVRKVDQLGRVVIPKEMRDVLQIDDGDFIEILQNNHNVILRKYYETCVFCGSDEELYRYKNVRICDKCRKNIGKSVKHDIRI